MRAREDYIAAWRFDRHPEAAPEPNYFAYGADLVRAAMARPPARCAECGLAFDGEPAFTVEDDLLLCSGGCFESFRGRES